MSIPNITADRQLCHLRGLFLTGVLIAGVTGLFGCNRSREEAGNVAPVSQPGPVADWGGRKVVPVQPPPDWSMLTAGNGVQVATPVSLRLREDNDPLPGFDIKIYQANHDGVRYQVSVSAEPRRASADRITRADRIEILFDGLLTNFATSGRFRQNGPAERLTVEGYPGVQAQFADGPLNAVVRAVHYEEQVVSLSILKMGPVEESEPAVGNFLNSLRTGK